MKKRGSLCPGCGRIVGKLPVECSCGMKFCSEGCMYAHMHSHRKIQGLPWIPPAKLIRKW
jgi:hypothetical protein